MENKRCIALGDFDGVHLGHQAVIDATVKNEYNFIPAVYTFTYNCKGAKLITDNALKSNLLYALGIKEIFFGEFEKIKDLSPIDFVEQVLMNKYNAHAIVCGENFRFGKNAQGDVGTLKRICDKHGIILNVINIQNNENIRISSSDIRKLIESGNIEKANELLARRFSVSGTVLHGKHLGNKNNAPTANIAFSENSIIPSYGVYITNTIIDGARYNSISNIGVRPSVESSNIPNIETNIFKLDEEIYGATITVEFIKKLRNEIKFDSKEQLFKQVLIDISNAKEIFNGETNE